MIQIERVSKKYVRPWGRSEILAVSNISLHVAEGEAFGFIGQNGAGKSTTIKMLVGAIRPTCGDLKVFGCPVSDPRSRQGLGYVPENPCLYDYLTPLEVLQIGLRLHRVSPENSRQHCLQWLERFDLARVANKPLRTFSKGMQQRTALAHALAIRPRLLILDEPLSGLDPLGRKEVVDILDDYRRSGGTLFFSSHVLHDVERIADRFGLIHQGELLTIRSPREIVADQADRYLLRYRGEVAIRAAELVRAGLYRLEVAADELAAAIELVRQSGAVLQDVQPKVSLESVFFRMIASSGAAAETA